MVSFYHCCEHPTQGSGTDSGKANLEIQLIYLDKNHLIATDDVIVPPGIEGKIVPNIMAIPNLK
jgi:hypothetical protein